MNFHPKEIDLKDGQCAVLHEVAATGHILNNDLTLFNSKENEVMEFIVFNSYKEAEEYVLATMKANPNIGCIMYFANKEAEHYLPDGYDNYNDKKLVIETIPIKRKWWEFWK